MDNQEITQRLITSKNRFYAIKGQADGMVSDALTVLVSEFVSVIKMIQDENLKPKKKVVEKEMNIPVEVEDGKIPDDG